MPLILREPLIQTSKTGDQPNVEQQYRGVLDLNAAVLAEEHLQHLVVRRTPERSHDFFLGLVGDFNSVNYYLAATSQVNNSFPRSYLILIPF